MSGEPSEPLSAPQAAHPARPLWVGLAARLTTDAGEPVLRVDDPNHARLLRQIGARGLHESLLACLPLTDPQGGPQPTTAVAEVAARALRALLPGNPKPVAALTRSPEVVALLLRALDARPPAREVARHNLAAAVLFSLALSSALHEHAVLPGPLILRHTPTRRGVTLGVGQTLRLGPGELHLDERQLDPWGTTLAGHLVDHGGFAVLRSEQSALPDAARLRAAHALAHPQDDVAQIARELFDALEVDSTTAPKADGVLRWTLPLAVGRARLPAMASGSALARAWLREGVLHRLTLLRLVDPLVQHEAALDALTAHADRWACARVGHGEVLSGPREAVQRADLTPMGERVLTELQLSG